MSKVSTFFSNRKGQILQSALVAVILPLILFISIPIEIFSKNLEEFNFSLSDFMPTSILFAVLTALVIFAILFVLPKKANKIVAFIILALEFMFFLQGTYLGAGSSFAGDGVGGQEPLILKIINIVVWVAIISALIVLSTRQDKKGWIKNGSYIIIAILIITQIVTLVTSFTVAGVFSTKKERMLEIDATYVEKDLTTLNLSTLSNSENVFYFVVDRFDEEYALQAYKKDESVFDNFIGFTWFQDYVSLYGHTFPGICSMLTEKHFDMENSTRVEYFKKAYDSPTPLSELYANGYKINLFTQNYYAYSGSLPSYVENFNTGVYKAENKALISMGMAFMAVLRCAPKFLAEIGGAAFNSNMCNSWVGFDADNGEKAYLADNKVVWENLNNKKFSTESGKMFSFIHIEGCHNINYDENFNKIGIFQSKNIVYSVKTSVKIIEKYLTELKENGMYDNATIIITGDHPFAHDDWADIHEPRLTALFVKPSNSTNDSLKISNAQVQQSNIWPTIFAQQGLTSSIVSGESVFDIPENQNREREYIWQTYEGNRTQQFTYNVVGEGKNLDNWKCIDKKVYDRFIAS